MEAIDEIGNSDPNSALVIEAFNVPYVLCDVGHFTVYDGKFKTDFIEHFHLISSYKTL